VRAEASQVAREEVNDLGHDQRVVEEADDGDDVGDEVDRHQEVPQAEHDRRGRAPRHRERPVEQQLEQGVDVTYEVAGGSQPSATQQGAKRGQLRGDAVADRVDVLDAHRGDPCREIGKLDECHRFSSFAMDWYRSREATVVHECNTCVTNRRRPG
jgi:hypothetical protein